MAVRRSPATRPSPAGELELPRRVFGDDPPVDVPLWMTALDVFFELPAGLEVPATEVASVVPLFDHGGPYVALAYDVYVWSGARTSPASVYGFRLEV